MDLHFDDGYQPAYTRAEAGLSFGLYFCPICQEDTLHQVIDVDFDNYDIRCGHCKTTSVTRADYFDSYEEEAVFWGNEMAVFLPDAEEII